MKWPDIRQALLQGRYRLNPVRRVMIPQLYGSPPELGIPTAVDRYQGTLHLSRVVRFYLQPMCLLYITGS
jgi:hypothetical protein